MKTLFTTLFLLAFTFIAYQSNAQGHHDINKLDKEIELLLDSSAKHMVLFILEQKESEYDLAIEKVTRAEAMNEDLITKSKGEKGIAGKIEDELIQERKEEIATYKKKTLKTDIMNEKPAARKVKVKHKGKNYLLTDKSKKLYDLFLSYVPKN